MNRERRSRLRELSSQIDLIRSEVETLRHLEESALATMPLWFREGEVGDRLRLAIDAMQDAEGALEDASSMTKDASDV